MGGLLICLTWNTILHPSAKDVSGFHKCHKLCLICCLLPSPIVLSSNQLPLDLIIWLGRINHSPGCSNIFILGYWHNRVVIQLGVHRVMPLNNNDLFDSYVPIWVAFLEPYILVTHRMNMPTHRPPCWVWLIQNQPIVHSHQHQSVYSLVLYLCKSLDSHADGGLPDKPRWSRTWLIVHPFSWLVWVIETIPHQDSIPIQSRSNSWFQKHTTIYIGMDDCCPIQLNIP